jgi:ribonucleotide monophosphatase NagD (HAD superfamily)
VRETALNIAISHLMEVFHISASAASAAPSWIIGAKPASDISAASSYGINSIE